MAQAARAAAFVLCVARTLSDGPSCAEEGHASWTRESWATARAAGLARPGAPFPVFLKFHKVGKHLKEGRSQAGRSARSGTCRTSASAP